jgi:hypothetical protein
MRALHRALMSLPLLLAIVGCWRHRGEASVTSPYARSTLHIENHHWLDVDIYVVHDGQRSRLGTVTAATSKDFIFPRSMLGQLGQIRLIADPVGGGGGISTDVIVVRPGTQVAWTLESSLSRSSLAVY